MATSGEVFLAVMGLLAGSALACSRPAVPGAGEPRSSAVTGRAELPQAWSAALEDGAVPVPAGTRLVPFAVAGDASRFFASCRSAEWSGVVAVETRTGALARIRRFEQPEVDQAAAGSFDGRWLAWAELHSRTDWNDWTLRAWDSKTGKVFDVAVAPRPGGATVQGPLVLPEVSEGRLAWVQANAQGRGEVHLYSLARRRDQVLASGAAAPPVAFWGGKVLWQEIDVPGERGHLAMASVADGRQAEVPEPLASIHRVAYLAANEAWVTWGDGSSVWAWSPGGGPARLMMAPGAGRAEFLSLSGSTVSWDDPEGPVIADLGAGTMARLTQHRGGRFARGSALLVYQPEGGEPGHAAPLRISVVNLRGVP